MKKALSFAMAAIMLFALCSVGVSANPTVSAPNVIGTAADEVGVETFTPTDTDAAIQLTLGKIIHKYAVDVVFPGTMTINTGDIAWNVKSKKYELAGSNTALTNTTFDIDVVNHSDLPVYTKAAIAAEAAYTSLLKCTGVENTVVDKAPINETSSTEAAGTTVTIQPSIAENTSGDWVKVLNKIAGGNWTESNNVKIATAVVTVSKDTLA